MTVGKAIKLTRSDDQSITVTSGTDTFTLTFFEVPRVSDNAERRFQRVRKPLADDNGSKEYSPGSFFPFKLYGSPTDCSAKDEKEANGSHFLAIKDDKAFAIRMTGDTKESAFKVKVWIGGVNVLQHTTHGKKTQDYFVVSEQKWVWGKQVGKDTARQFRVFRRGREKLSLRYQIQKNNIKKEVEIEITSRRLVDPTGPFPPLRLTDKLLYEQLPFYSSSHHDYTTSPVPYLDGMATSQAAFQRPTASNYMGPSTSYVWPMHLLPLPPSTASHELASDNLAPTIFEQAIPEIPPPLVSSYRPQASSPTSTELMVPLFNVDRVGSSPPLDQVMEAPAFAGTASSETTQYLHYTAPMPSYPQVVDVISQSGPPRTSPSPTEYGTIRQSIDYSPSSPPPQHISRYPGLIDPELITTTSYDYSAPLPLELSDLDAMSPVTTYKVSYPSLPEPGVSSHSSLALPPDVMPAPPATLQEPTSSDARPMPISVSCAMESPAKSQVCFTPFHSSHSVATNDPPPSPLSPPSLPPTSESAPPKPPSDQESIHSGPEEDMLPHQMVVGAGGLIEQIVHPDKHPNWIDDCTVTLKFKIVDPGYLETEARVKKLGTTGGNFGEVPNPLEATFRKHAPVVADPDGLRRNIRSPMELEIMEVAGTMNVNGNRENSLPGPGSSKLPADSGVGLAGERTEGNGGEEENAQDFDSLTKEARNQPRGLINDLRMKKKSRNQRKHGGVRIQMVMKQGKHEPKVAERKSRWRTFIDALRRVLTLGR